MKAVQILLLLLLAAALQAQAPAQLPLWHDSLGQAPPADWLIQCTPRRAELYRSPDGRDLILCNGLLQRSFRLSPAVACTDFKNLSSGQQLLRAVSSEARLRIDGREYLVGGLSGQTERAYLLPEWLDAFTPLSTDFRLTDIATDSLRPYLHWQPGTWAMHTQQASGKTLVFTYSATAPALTGLLVRVHYELVDGLPLVVKWLSLENTGSRRFKIEQVVHETLALVEEESAVIGRPEQMKKQHGLYVETNFAYNNAMRYELSDQTTHWRTDTAYRSQVNYNYETPCILEIYTEHSPGIELAPGDTFRSVRSHELLLDSYDRERRGMAIRHMYRTIAPWTSQNPIFMHLISQNDQQVRDIVDQCAETGYEGIILSFGSHCNMEDTSAANIRRWRALANYAGSKNILLGSYALFSSRRISDADDVIDPKTGRPGGAFFGNAPCFGSAWGLAFAAKIKYFLRETGFRIFENDGPYPGDVCASTSHPGHKNLDDSQWRQMEIQKDLYRWCNENGVYVNAPDWYFLDGTHKIALGYRETNFSLSRAQQKILNRQNIYDGTWEKTPSMGWGFVPLTRYQGGGEEAVLEPLSEHLSDYEQLMVQYYGAGVQACYRGPRLYDTDKTKSLVQKTIAWHKQYRDILNSDIIHLRRPDGRDWDGILHVNPDLPDKGLLILYNPLKTPITRRIRVPLYYTGIQGKPIFFNLGSLEEMVFQAPRNYECALTVTIPAEGWVWYTIR
ncbi:MAG: alpha-galactosidase [Saprospiraceae bacterium]|nr:alpha-galactosidase [Saprospiraceae bacterium]